MARLGKKWIEIKLVGKTSHWSTKAVILEKFDMALKRAWKLEYYVQPYVQHDSGDFRLV